MRYFVIIIIILLSIRNCYCSNKSLSPQSLIKDNNAISSIILSVNQVSPLAQKLFKENFIFDGQNILSIGAGSGIDEEYFSKKCAVKVLGTDIKDEMVDYAKTKSNQNLEFKKLNITKEFNLEPKFNLIYARNLLHYFGNSQLKFLLKEVFKTLRHDGRFVFQLKSKKDYYFNSPDIIREFREDGFVFLPQLGYSRNFLNEREIKSLLNEFGFEIEIMYESKERMYTDEHDSNLLTVIAKKRENIKVSNYKTSISS